MSPEDDELLKQAQDLREAAERGREARRIEYATAIKSGDIERMRAMQIDLTARSKAVEGDHNWTRTLETAGNDRDTIGAFAKADERITEREIGRALTPEQREALRKYDLAHDPAYKAQLRQSAARAGRQELGAAHEALAGDRSPATGAETAGARQARRFEEAIKERAARRAALKQQEKQAAREVTGRGEPRPEGPSSPNGPRGPEGTRFPDRNGPAKETGAARFDDAVKARKAAEDYDDRRRKQAEPEAQRRASPDRPKEEEGRTQFEVAVKARRAAREGASQREVTDKDSPQRPDRTHTRPFGRGFGR